MEVINIDLSVNGGCAGMQVMLRPNSPEIDPARRRPLVLICPGGGYENLSQREGEPVAQRLLAMGYHAAVLQYSVAPHRYPQALCELALAVAALRQRADTWHILPDKIVVMGFSAGGHLATSLGAFWHRPFLAGLTGKTAGQMRPNALVLCYPVITMGKQGHTGSRDNLLGPKPGAREREAQSIELHADGNMPPVFLWHTLNDALVPADNSLLLATALRKHAVPHELHLYPHGPHGLALANAETAPAGQPEYISPHCAGWINLAGEWIDLL